MSKQNYLFTKKLYYKMMIDFKKKGDEKGIEWANQGLEWLEELYKDFDFTNLRN